MEYRTYEQKDRGFWERLDRRSRDIAKKWLEQAGAEDIGQSEGNCVWDLSAVIRGKKVSVEVKDRTFPHDRYGDVLVETDKQVYTELNYRFDKSLAVNMFTDGVVCAADLYDKRAKVFDRKCRRTTMLGDYEIVTKTFVSLPQTLSMRWDGERLRRI